MEDLVKSFVEHKIRGLNIKKVKTSQYYEYANGYIKAFLKENGLEKLIKLLDAIAYTFQLSPSKEAFVFLSIYTLVVFVLDDHLEKNPQDVQKWIKYFKDGKCPKDTPSGLIGQFYFSERKRLISDEFYQQFNELTIEWLNNFNEMQKFKSGVENRFTEQEFIEWRRNDFNGGNFRFIHTLECLRVTDDISNNTDFIAFNNEVGKHLFLINDLFSFIKETQEDRVELNYLFIKMKNNGLTLEKAMDLIVAEINQCETMAHQYGDKLIASNIEGMAKYVQGLFGMMDGNGYWSATCSRYKNPELKFYSFNQN